MGYGNILVGYNNYGIVMWDRYEYNRIGGGQFGSLF